MIGVTLCGLLLEPIEEVLTRFIVLRTRMNEYQADAFSADLGYGEALIDGLKRLSVKEKVALNTDSWYSWYHHDHPTLVERILAIRALPSQKGAQKSMEMKKKD